MYFALTVGISKVIVQHKLNSCEYHYILLLILLNDSIRTLHLDITVIPQFLGTNQYLANITFSL